LTDLNFKGDSKKSYVNFKLDDNRLNYGYILREKTKEF